MGKPELKVPWFDRDPRALDRLRRVLRAQFPTLHALVRDDRVCVRGTLSIVHEGVEIDRYSLSIDLPDDYPASSPAVYETGGRIPRTIDRHVFPTGNLCLGVREALWIELRGNFSIAPVLNGPVRSYLIGNALVEAGEPWPHGHRAHGVDGILEFYADEIGAKDPRQLFRFIVALLHQKVRGHWPCPCDSGRIVRKCHGDAVQRLRGVPRWILVGSAHAILERLKEGQKKAA